MDVISTSQRQSSSLEPSFTKVIDTINSPFVEKSVVVESHLEEDHTHRTDEMSDDSAESGAHFDKEEESDTESVVEPESKSQESWEPLEDPTTRLDDMDEQDEGVLLTSILKRSQSDPLHLKDSKSAWKCLPKPDMALIRSLSVPVVGVDKQTASKSTRVKFDKIIVRSYQQTLGDNPSVTYGPPISLDWDYEQHDAIDLDEYEGKRGPRRLLRQMVLSYYHRKNVLSWQYGFDEAELKKAKKEVERYKMRRSMTRVLLPYAAVETALESAGRKAKRILGRGNQGSQRTS